MFQSGHHTEQNSAVSHSTFTYYLPWTYEESAGLPPRATQLFCHIPWTSTTALSSATRNPGVLQKLRLRVCSDSLSDPGLCCWMHKMIPRLTPNSSDRLLKSSWLGFFNPNLTTMSCKTGILKWTELGRRPPQHHFPAFGDKQPKILLQTQITMQSPEKGRDSIWQKAEKNSGRLIPSF